MSAIHPYKRKRHYTDWLEVDRYIKYLKGKVKSLNKKLKKEKV